MNVVASASTRSDQVGLILDGYPGKEGQLCPVLATDEHSQSLNFTHSWREVGFSSFVTPFYDRGELSKCLVVEVLCNALPSWVTSVK